MYKKNINNLFQYVIGYASTSDDNGDNIHDYRSFLWECRTVIDDIRRNDNDNIDDYIRGFWRYRVNTEATTTDPAEGQKSVIDIGLESFIIVKRKYDISEHYDDKRGYHKLLKIKCRWCHEIRVAEQICW